MVAGRGASWLPKLMLFPFFNEHYELGRPAPVPTPFSALPSFAQWLTHLLSHYERNHHERTGPEIKCLTSMLRAPKVTTNSSTS